VFHLGLDEAALRGAKLAIVPGDPARSEPIATLMDQPEFLCSKREFTSWLGKLGDDTVVVCSTGIGGPSTSIAVEELAQLGVRTFLRAGTTGAIQPRIGVGDLIVTTGAVRLDGASHHFAPAAYPAVADFDCTTALVRAARDAGRPVHVGITASSDTFYPGQERYDTFSGRVDQDWQGSLQRWQDLNVLNYEMEAATLFTMCSALGLRAGMITAALVNRVRGDERPAPSALEQIERDLIRAAVGAARILSAA
jgi:uridine phosphorylase